jgi:hypothetical protein
VSASGRYRVMSLCETLNKLLSKFRRRNYFLLGMKMELSTRTLAIAKSLFSESDSKIVESLLLECCANKVPGCDDWSQDDLERIWISVLKLSDGNVNKLLDAIKLANTDYRDLFMSAGFGYDSQAHRLWQP